MIHLVFRENIFHEHFSTNSTFFFTTFFKVKNIKAPSRAIFALLTTSKGRSKVQ